MLTLELELLTGAYRASLPDGSSPEWPPHPERVFSALVQAWGDGGRSDEERSALEWLEGQPDPTIEASAYASARTAPTFYVPPNDPRGHELAVLPTQRRRQARTFQASIPTDPVVRFRWNATPPDEVLLHLEALANRVASLGHSSSLVRCAIAQGTEPVLPIWKPVEQGGVALRAVYAGRLADLEDWFGDGGSPRERPRSRRVVQYSPKMPEGAHKARTIFGGLEDWFVFEEVGGFRPDLLGFAHVARRVRDALMTFAPEPVPETISGHADDGSPTRRPHLAFVPLANVGSQYATGDLLGFAIVLPRGLDPNERRTVLQAIARFAEVDADGEGRARVHLTREHTWELARTVIPSRATLRPDRWCRPSRTWVTATPIVLDRFPAEGSPLEEAAIVESACRNIGLPAPVEIELHKHSALRGAVPAYLPARGRANWTFPTNASFRNRPRRHVVLRFSEPVEGPVILGAGRFYGFGLCLPMPTEGSR